MRKTAGVAIRIVFGFPFSMGIWHYWPWSLEFSFSTELKQEGRVSGLDTVNGLKSASVVATADNVRLLYEW